jgi:hypothetical protein
VAVWADCETNRPNTGRLVLRPRNAISREIWRQGQRQYFRQVFRLTSEQAERLVPGRSKIHHSVIDTAATVLANPQHLAAYRTHPRVKDEYALAQWQARHAHLTVPTLSADRAIELAQALADVY